jgi:hypothetical protein
MWKTEYTAESECPIEAVWTALRELHTGVRKSDGGDVFEIHGPFVVGTEVSVTPQGQDTFTAKITELHEPVRYADETVFGDLILRFRHVLTSTDNGTRVTHQLEIEGSGADAAGPELGPQISSDFPAAMDSLFESAVAIEKAARG